MARRRTSAFEDSMEIVSRLPWWVGLLLAVVAYSVFHQIASMDTTPPKDMAAMGGYVGKTLYKTLAEFLQYIIPIACLIGATLSVLARRKRGELFARAATQPAQDPLNTMTWPEFEILVGESFRRQGYAVTEVGGGGAGGGGGGGGARGGRAGRGQGK